MSKGVTIATLLLLHGALAGGAVGAEKSKEEQRAEVRQAANETLARLYQVQPSAKGAIEKAAGYAVFNSFGMKLGVAGTGRGKGLAVDNGSGRETFMKMLEVQAGLGFGIKKFQLVWVFETPAALTQFTTSGWELGGQTTASAKAKEQGAALRTSARCSSLDFSAPAAPPTRAPATNKARVAVPMCPSDRPCLPARLE